MNAPPRVGDPACHWAEPPPERSARCAWWVRRFAAGWRRNRRLRAMGYYESAAYFGVWIWEYLHVLSPLLAAAEDGP